MSSMCTPRGADRTHWSWQSKAHKLYQHRNLKLFSYLCVCRTRLQYAVEHFFLLNTLCHFSLVRCMKYSLNHRVPWLQSHILQTLSTSEEDSRSVTAGHVTSPTPQPVCAQRSKSQKLRNRISQGLNGVWEVNWSWKEGRQTQIPGWRASRNGWMAQKSAQPWVTYRLNIYL